MFCPICLKPDLLTTSPNPCSSWHWVELRDDLSASLLQARLIELRQPIRLKIA